MIPTRQKPSAAQAAFAAPGAEATEPYTVRVPDLGAALLRLNNGATASFSTSLLCAGHKNDPRFEIHVAKLSLSRVQEDPNRLWIGRGQQDQLLNRDPACWRPKLADIRASREGTARAGPTPLKNTLGDIFQFIAESPDAGNTDGNFFPTFADGCRAAAISDALVRIQTRGGVWTKVES